MQRPNQPHSRINLVELKAQLVKRLGLERSKLYFYYLNKLLSLKLNKVEFNKFCLRVIGRENVKLHNQLIHSVLKNACNAKVPPPAPSRHEDGFYSSSNGYQQQDDDVLLSSPWGAASGISVWSDGKVDFSSQQSTITGNNGVLEKGELDSCEVQKLLQHHQVVSDETNNEGEIVLHHPAKESAHCLLSVDSDKRGEVLYVADGKELSNRRSIRAPLGIPLCSFSVGSAGAAPQIVSSGRCFSSYDSGGLLDTKTLKERMQHIAAAHGLDGVSMDCATVLNNGLDFYLKRLIRSSIELVGTRHGHDLIGNNTHKHHSHGKLVNRDSPAYHFQVQRCDVPLSSIDFKVAMRLKPQQLGEDWPMLLEKICTCSNEK